MDLFYYFPNINSVWGLILYSFLAYIISVVVAGLVSSYMTNIGNADQERQKKIVKQRQIKEKQAKELLKKIN